MAVLEQIRVKFGIGITIIIALALLSFIIDPSTLSSVTQNMSSKNDVGKIYGKSVSYLDYQKDVEQFSKVYEILTNGQSQGEQGQREVRDQVWQNYLSVYLLNKKAREAGINVGDAELVDLKSGDNISPMIAQNPMFMDENGMFSKERLVEFLAQASEEESGRYMAYWNFIQEQIFNNQYFMKYMSLFQASSFTNKLMADKLIEESNNTTDVEFVLVPFGYQKDTTITVSSSEIKKYYNAHKDFFQQPASRDIEYVVVEIVPSAEDLEATRQQLLAVYDEFAQAENMKSFLLKNSDRKFDARYYQAGELNTVSSEVNDFVFGEAAGVSEIIKKDNNFMVAKVLDTKKLPVNISVKVMMAGDATEVNDSLKTVLEGLEPMQMTQNYLIPGCESLFTAETGKPVFVDSPQYGKLIAEVVSKGEVKEMKQVAILVKESVASNQTVNKYYAEANEFAVKAAGKYENYKKACEELGKLSMPATIYESTDRLGTVEGTKEITRWAFESKKAGKVSDIFTVNQSYYFVVAVKGVHKEGYATVAESKDFIENTLYSEKLGAKKAEEVAQKIEGLSTLESIADALGTTVSTSEDITFASLTSQSSDSRFAGAVSVSPEGVVSKPFVGSRGVYVYKVTKHATGSFFTEDDAKNQEASAAQMAAQMLVPVMQQDGDVKDNRARFY